MRGESPRGAVGVERGPADAPTIVHADETIVAVAKPPGQTVVPARGEPVDHCLRARVESAIGQRVFVVHRIDRDASGLVVFALTADAHRELSLAFETRRVEKRYLAFVAGDLQPDSGRIDVALHSARRGKSRPAHPGEPGSKPSQTDYAVVRRWRRGETAVSLVAARPVTGRPHQIRVHLRSCGTPILFDPLYADARSRQIAAGGPCTRLALHAESIVLPASGSRPALRLEAAWAADLIALAAWLDAVVGVA